MQSTSRQPRKLRRHQLHGESVGSSRAPRPAPRRQSSRALIIRAALMEA